MRERSTRHTTGAVRSAALEARYGRTWLRPLLFALAALALALAMALMVRPGVALAAPSPFVDDTTPDFEAGTNDNTQVGNGEVTLAPDVGVDQEFSGGPELPPGWSRTQTWQSGGTATVANGQLTVDASQVQTDQAYGPGRSLEFTATFGARQFQSLGFATDLADVPNNSWAQFGTANSTNTLSARTNDNGVVSDVVIPNSGQYIGTEHDYRIEWATNEVRFFIDGNLVHTQPVTIESQMPLVASDFNSGGPDLSVNNFTLSTYPTSGQFTSRVFEANGISDWQQLTSTVEPSGAEVTFETRSGNSSTPNATWSPWTDVGAGGEIQSPNGRYIQYRATLTTSDPSSTPALERVEITFEDVQGPTVTNNKPTGKIRDRTPKISAVVRDETSELAKEDIRLYLDGPPPKTNFDYYPATDRLVYQSRRLSYGGHTVRIEATDDAGNTTEKVWTFRIAKRR